jgi:hypothetical protein
MNTFAHAWKIDLWAKADAVAGFDALNVTPVPEP